MDLYTEVCNMWSLNTTEDDVGTSIGTTRCHDDWQCDWDRPKGMHGLGPTLSCHQCSFYIHAETYVRHEC